MRNSLFVPLLCIVCVSAAKADYTNGIFLLNEDWFGHNESSMNFYNSGSNSIEYRVFSSANNGDKHLGNTSQFAQIFGDRIYIMSKQNYGSDESTGGRLIVADAKTLEQIASIPTLDGKDGRAFVGVDQTTGYVGTSGGIYLFDIEQNALGSMIDGTASTGSGLYSDQIGDMVRFRDRVYAAKQGVGVLVISTSTSEVVGTVSLPDIVTVFVTSKGDLYAANADSQAEFVKINPDDLSTEAIDINDPDNAACVFSSWGAWRSAPVAVDPVENSVYYYNKEYAKSIMKYNFDTQVLTRDFIVLPEGEPDGSGRKYGQIIYSTGVSINPVTRELMIAATEEGWSTHFSNNWIHFANPDTGEITKTIELDKHYWFPAMAIYPDSYYPAFELDPISLNMGATYDLDLTGIAKDADNNDNLIVMSATVADSDICSLSSDGYGKYVLTPVSVGDTKLTVRADSNGHITSKDVAVSVYRQAGVGDCLSGQEVSAYYAGGNLHILNASEREADLYNLQGSVIASFRIEGGHHICQLTVNTGVYVLRVGDRTFKIIVK